MDNLTPDEHTAIFGTSRGPVAQPLLPIGWSVSTYSRLLQFGYLELHETLGFKEEAEILKHPIIAKGFKDPDVIQEILIELGNLWGFLCVLEIAQDTLFQLSDKKLVAAFLEGSVFKVLSKEATPEEAKPYRKSRKEYRLHLVAFSVELASNASKSLATGDILRQAVIRKGYQNPKACKALCATLMRLCPLVHHFLKRRGLRTVRPVDFTEIWAAGDSNRFAAIHLHQPGFMDMVTGPVLFES